MVLAHIRHRVIVWCILLTASLPASAGVFESIHPTTGQPVRWADPQAIPYNIDEGGLGQLNHDQAVDLVEAMMGVWENEGGGAFRFVDKGSLAADVSVDTMADYVNTSVCTDTISPKILSMIKGQSPIIFDTDGAIIDALSGVGASRKIVGKAAFRCFKGTLEDPQGVTQAFLIMNGRFIDGLPDPVDLPINVYAGVVLHELGHYLGLHHSMVNHDIYAGVLSGGRPQEDSKYVPVMYPLILTNSVASTVLKPDDVAVLRSLYPLPDDKWGIIDGKIMTDDLNPVLAANVTARRTDDPLCQAVSAISGRECTPTPSVLSETCGNADMVGHYSIRGLPKGQYTIEVGEIVDQGGARANMFPKGSGQDLPGEPIIMAQPLDVDGNWVRGIDFTLLAIAATHLTGIDESYFLKSNQSECKTDPVNYRELMATSGTVPADSSPAEASPLRAAAPAMGGCSLMR